MPAGAILKSAGDSFVAECGVRVEFQFKAVMAIVVF